MGYGKPVEQKKYPSVGLQEGCSIVGDALFTTGKASNGNSYAEITFAQADGSSVVTKVWDGQTEEEQAEANAWIHHVCTKIVPADEYEAAVAESQSFEDFINRVNQVTGGAYQGKTYRGIFHYNTKGYVTTPRYAPFFESMDVPTEKSDLHKFMNGSTKSAQYVKARLVRPEQPKPDAEVAATAESGDLPF